MGEAKPPLRIRVLYHPRSESASQLAGHTLLTFMQSGGTPGLRIPVFFAPSIGDGIPPRLIDLDLGSAEHTLVVFLADQRMALRYGEAATSDAWGSLLVELLEWAPSGTTPNAVLPVALDDRAFGLDQRLKYTSFVRLDVLNKEQQADELSFHVAVRALQLLLLGAIPSGSKVKAPLALFISHAKKNLPREPCEIEGPVRSLLAQLAQGPVDQWYDAKDIPPGGRFDEEIKNGVLKSSAMVCVVTDDYSSREWCRVEALEAKRAGRPILVVNALTGTVPRTFPYLGNAPEVRWNGNSDARRVIRLAVCEALRYQHSIKGLEIRKESDDLVLGTAPEAVNITRLSPKTKCILYPDLPLSHEELELLRELAPDIKLTTPLSRLACWERPPGIDLIGLSLSSSPDAQAYGLSQDHLSNFAEDACLFLLLAGLKLGYGGMIGYEGSGQDFVKRLFGVARGYSPLGAQVGVGFQPIVNYVGWPIYQRYGDSEYALYHHEAELIKVPMPSDIGLEEAALQPDVKGFFPSAKADGDADLQASRRYAWSRGMTEMRCRMTKDTTARLIMGGKLDGYSGILPGILEEALLSLRAGKPLYLVGAFGGAARMVADALEGRPSKALTAEFFRDRIPHYDGALEIFKRLGRPFEQPDDIAKELRELGNDGPAKALNNGLDDAENRELFTSTDPLRLVEMVLLGLARWSRSKIPVPA